MQSLYDVTYRDNLNYRVNIMATFQERLKDLRNSKGWSQKELAEQFTEYMRSNREADDKRKHNYYAQHISEWENKSMPRSDTFSKLAKFLNVSVPYLAGLVDDPKSILTAQELHRAEEELISALRNRPQEALVVYRAFGITPPPLYLVSDNSSTPLLEEGDDESDTPGINEAANR